MKKACKLLSLFLIFSLVIFFISCQKEKSNPTSPGLSTPYYNLANDVCYTCHVASLNKIITTTSGNDTIPLYVDKEKYAVKMHRGLACVDCHEDIIITTGTHGNANRTYGSWARLSVKDTTVSGATSNMKTSNYYTKAAMSCLKSGCHNEFQGFMNNDHHTIEDMKAAHLVSVTSPGGGTDVAGEVYDHKDCGRCHSTCATCHFKAPIVRNDKTANDILDFWNGIKNGSITEASVNASALTEWSIKWMKNVEGHDFRTGNDLRANNDVCQTCHIGYSQPKTLGYYNLTAPTADTAYTWAIRRHPQVQELSKSSQANIHETRKCVDCHTGTHTMNLTTLENGKREVSDVTCGSCHTAQQATLKFHTTINCVGCHDANLEVWRDMSVGTTGSVEPVLVKHKEVKTWPSHLLTKTVSCNKCHITGNRVGATTSPHSGTIHQ